MIDIDNKTKQGKQALKEWAIAVEALTAGQTMILLRKGGIRESSFQVKDTLVWLYPTYEHQKPHLLKPEYAPRVRAVESGWHPNTIEIQSYARITDVLSLADKNKIEALHPYHIWNEQMVEERLKWKPKQPITVLLMRVFCLPEPKKIEYENVYGGCKSWIDLVEPIAYQPAIPAIADTEYLQKVRAIKNSLNV